MVNIKLNFILILVIVLTNFIVKGMILSKLPPDTITFWLDGYYHLGISRIIVETGMLPEKDPFWLSKGVPHIYPDGYEIILSALRLFGISGTTAANLLMVLSSTFSLIAIFLISYKIFRNEFIAFLTSILLLFIPGYWEATALPIPNTLAVFFIPTIFYFLIRDENTARVKIFLLGILSASLSLVHIMSFEVFFLILLLYAHFILFFEKKPFRKVLSILTVLGFAFLFSSLWWVKLIKIGLEHLSVQEMDEFQMFHHYMWYLSVTLFFAPLGIVFGLFKKNKHLFLIISWILISWIFIENYRLDHLLYKDVFKEQLSFVRDILKPNWGQRFFVYISQPIAICVGLFLSEIHSKTHKRVKLKVQSIPLIIFCLLISFLVKDVYFNPPWFMHLVHDVWVSETELETIKNLGNIMPKNSFLNADFPFSEVYFGLTGNGATISPQLRAAIPLTTYLDDYIGIYYADIEETKEIAERYGITHVAISERIKERGHFAITSSRWPYKLYGGVGNANLTKFYDQKNFKKVYSYRDVEIFCFQPC